MTFSRRATLGTGGIAVGAGLLMAVALTPALAGAATPALAAGGCSATATIETQWGSGPSGGQIIGVRVVNTSAATATRWAVTWTLGADQRIASTWNAATTVANRTVTAVNMPYNGTVVAGGSATFGMQLTGTGPAPVLSCDNGTTPPTSGPPSSTPATGADVTITDKDVLTTVTVLVGQTLGVSLSPDHRQPVPTGTALQLVSGTGGFPTGQPVTALFRAVAAGQADLMSTFGCSSNPTPCPGPLWLVHVKVVPVPTNGSGQTVTVTTASNTSTVTLRLGDTLLVTLPSAYAAPKVAASGPLVAYDVAGGYPTAQPLSARYLAVAQGQADVSTISDDACNHAPTPCPSPPVRWVVHVVVTA